MKKFLYTLLVMPLFFVACGNDDEPTPTPKPEQTTLKLTSEPVAEFTAEGGQGVITYTYSGTKGEGDKDDVSFQIATITITCEAEWIDVNRDNMLNEPITYTVDKNETTEAREAKIIGTIYEDSFEVTIKQAANTATPEPEPSFEGWGIIGTFNDWSAEEAIVMEQANDYYVAKAVELTTTDRFKFIKDGDNAINRGGNGHIAEVDYFYTAQQWGSDIRVSKDGTYDIYLNNKENTYYIMSQGKSPEEALEPIAPGEDLWEVHGNFEGDKARLTTNKSYLVAKGVVFNSTTAEFDIRVNDAEKIYGAEKEATYAIEEQIKVIECNTKIRVEVEAETEYDIYYRAEMASVWVMPAGTKPFIWKSATGMAWDSTNFLISLQAEGLELYMDIYCPKPAENYIIPEGVYYVIDENKSGYYFNLENEWDIRIEGFKTKYKSGTMEIKHISGGYDISVDVESIHNHKVKVQYTGPIDEIPMQKPITNPS